MLNLILQFSLLLNVYSTYSARKGCAEKSPACFYTPTFTDEINFVPNVLPSTSSSTTLPVSPGSRHSFSIIPEPGNSASFYLFGGIGCDAQQDCKIHPSEVLDDLWYFDPIESEFVFLYGNELGERAPVYTYPGNEVGGRYGMSSFMTEEKIFIFGGRSHQYIFSELWTFEMVTSIGIWNVESGDHFQSILELSDEEPGPRMYSPSWFVSGHFFCYGGSAIEFAYHDLWELDISVMSWSRVEKSGAEVHEEVYPLVHDAKFGKYHDLNHPGSVYSASSWVVGENSLLMFGGKLGITMDLEQTSIGAYNTLWEFDTRIEQWRLLSGDYISGSGSVFGKINESPLPRASAGSWVRDNQLFIFGGEVYSGTKNGNINDIWFYDLSNSNWNNFEITTYSVVGINGNGFYSVGNSTSGYPFSRQRFEVFYQKKSEKMYLFGGNYGTFSEHTHSGGSPLSDLWILFYEQKCFGLYQHDPNVCGGSERGFCISTDNCTCQPEYYGISCEKKAPNYNSDPTEDGVFLVAGIIELNAFVAVVLLGSIMGCLVLCLLVCVGALLTVISCMTFSWDRKISHDTTFDIEVDDKTKKTRKFGIADISFTTDGSLGGGNTSDENETDESDTSFGSPVLSPIKYQVSKERNDAEEDNTNRVLFDE